jgi:hypothetical protein
VLIAALHDDVELAGPPELVRRALTDLVQQALGVGLEPAGHKFVLYVQTNEMLSHSEVTALERDIADWTDAQAIASGKRCVAQAQGLVTAGVPIGSEGFQRGYAGGVSSPNMSMHMSSWRN